MAASLCRKCSILHQMLFCKIGQLQNEGKALTSVAVVHLIKSSVVKGTTNPKKYTSEVI